MRFLPGLILPLMLIGSAFSQQKPLPALADPSVPQYNALAEVTLHGSVQSVQDYDCKVSGAKGGHITVKTENGVLEVHVGPAQFMKDYDIHFTVGDAVTLVGDPVTFDGRKAMLVREIHRGQDRYTLRDKDGKPYW